MQAPQTDRLLWTSIILGIGAAYFLIPKVLQHIKDAAIAPPAEAHPRRKQLPQNAEDALKLDTLQALAEGHSFELRNSAIKLIATRALKSGTKDLLLRDLASEDEHRRDDAINGLWLLIYSPALHEKDTISSLVDYPTFNAIITALVNVLPYHNRTTNQDKQPAAEVELPPSPIRPTYRPPHEISLMIMLTHLLHYRRTSSFGPSRTDDNLAIALSAGLVSRWLASYPFPCALPENSSFNYRKSDVTALFERKSWGSDDILMYEIMKVLTQSAAGCSSLRRAGLRASKQPEHHEDESWEKPWREENMENEDNDIVMVGGEDTAGIPVESSWQSFNSEEEAPRPRSVERSQEEEQLRRRNRQAVVVAERGAPLGRENILHRQNSRVPLAPMSNSSSSSGLPQGLLNGTLTFSDLEESIATGSLAPVSTQSPIGSPDVEAQLAELREEVDREMDVAEVREILQRTNYSPEQLLGVLPDIERSMERIRARERGESNQEPRSRE